MRRGFENWCRSVDCGELLVNPEEDCFSVACANNESLSKHDIRCPKARHQQLQHPFFRLQIQYHRWTPLFSRFTPGDGNRCFAAPDVYCFFFPVGGKVLTSAVTDSKVLGKPRSSRFSPLASWRTTGVSDFVCI